MFRVVLGLLLVVQMNCNVWCAAMDCHEHDAPAVSPNCHEAVPIDEEPDSDCEHENVLNEKSLQAKKATTDFTAALDGTVFFGAVTWSFIKVPATASSTIFHPPGSIKVLRI